MKTDIMVHCGNAPKMQQVIDLMIALADKDIEKVKSFVREDFVWRTVGKNTDIAFSDLDKKLSVRPDVNEIKIENALSHGNGAMCEGRLSFEDGESIYFCHVVKFVSTAKNALIKEAHTYFVN